MRLKNEKPAALLTLVRHLDSSHLSVDKYKRYALRIANFRSNDSFNQDVSLLVATLRQALESLVSSNTESEPLLLLMHEYSTSIEDKYEALFKYGDRLPDFEFG